MSGGDIWDETCNTDEKDVVLKPRERHSRKRGHGMCKGPEVRISLLCWENSGLCVSGPKNLEVESTACAKALGQDRAWCIRGIAEISATTVEPSSSEGLLRDGGLPADVM